MRWFVLLALVGCDPLAGNEYVGEPLFTLSGTLSAPDDDVRGVALVWQDPKGAGGPGVATTAVPVALEFPAAFRVSIPTVQLHSMLPARSSPALGSQQQAVMRVAVCARTTTASRRSGI